MIAPATFTLLVALASFYGVSVEMLATERLLQCLKRDRLAKTLQTSSRSMRLHSARPVEPVP